LLFILSIYLALPRQKRNEIQTQFMTGWIQVIVATISFGMGIDKSNVRYKIIFLMSFYVHFKHPI